jgi:hypothetical protein
LQRQIDSGGARGPFQRPIEAFKSRVSEDERPASSPLSEIVPDRCTPEFERMIARMGSPVAYGRLPAFIAEFLQLGRLVAPKTARRRTLRVGARLERLSAEPPPPQATGSVDDALRRRRPCEVDSKATM